MNVFIASIFFFSGLNFTLSEEEYFLLSDYSKYTFFSSIIIFLTNLSL